MNKFKLRYNILFFFLLPLVSFIIITLGSYHHVVILFTIPVLIAVMVFKNRVYLIHFSLMVISTVVVTYYVSSSFQSSLTTIFFVSLAILITSEIILYYNQKLEAQHSNLIESEKKLTKAQAIGNIGHWQLDIKNNKSEFSDQVYKILDIPKDNLTINRDTYLEAIHPEDREKINELNRISILEHKNYTVEYRILNKDGTIKYVEEICNIEYDKMDSHIKSFGTILDITERKVTEQKLNESEERYKMLSDLSFEGVLIHKDGFILDANESLFKMTGYNKDELLGKNIVEKVISKDYWQLIVDKFKSENHLSFEIEIRRKDGTKIDVEIESRNIIYKNRKVRVVAARDITSRKKSQEHIKKLSRAVEQSQVSIVITDINGNIEYVNPKFEEASGYNKVELIGKNHRIIKSGKVNKEVYKRIWETILEGKEWSGILPNRKKNGEIYWESIIISPIKDAIGKITNFVGVKEDITEKIRVEKELDMYRVNLENLVEERTHKLREVNLRLAKEIKKQLEVEQKVIFALAKEKELNELKSRFISTASHEFRTPLTTILSSVDLLEIFKKKENNEKFEVHLNKVRNSVRFLTSLIEDVLIFEQTNINKIGFYPVNTNLYNLAFYTFEEITLLARKKHNCIFNCKVGKDEIFYLDKKLIKLMISNILSNAIKYSPSGGNITLEVEKNNDSILIKVNDEGKGISQRAQKLIFEQFQRGDDVDGIQGTGLGLSIVKKSVDLHNGSIDVKSEVNKGSTFLISIPIISKR